MKRRHRSMSSAYMKNCSSKPPTSRSACAGMSMNAPLTLSTSPARSLGYPAHRVPGGARPGEPAVEAGEVAEGGHRTGVGVPALCSAVQGAPPDSPGGRRRAPGAGVPPQLVQACAQRSRRHHGVGVERQHCAAGSDRGSHVVRGARTRRSPRGPPRSPRRGPLRGRQGVVARARCRGRSPPCPPRRGGRRPAEAVARSVLAAVRDDDDLSLRHRRDGTRGAWERPDVATTPARACRASSSSSRPSTATRAAFVETFPRRDRARVARHPEDVVQDNHSRSARGCCGACTSRWAAAGQARALRARGDPGRGRSTSAAVAHLRAVGRGRCSTTWTTRQIYVPGRLRPRLRGPARSPTSCTAAPPTTTPTVEQGFAWDDPASRIDWPPTRAARSRRAIADAPRLADIADDLPFV